MAGRPGPDVSLAVAANVATQQLQVGHGAKQQSVGVMCNVSLGFCQSH